MSLLLAGRAELLLRAVGLSWGAPAHTLTAGRGGTGTGHRVVLGWVRSSPCPGDSCALSLAKGGALGVPAPRRHVEHLALLQG